MPDRNKVIKGLEICTSRPCYCTDCPYKKECCLDSQNVMEDALALLKKQETANLYKCPNCGTWVSAENVVRCKHCEWYDEQFSLCNNCGLPREQTFFCADGKRRIDDIS